MTYSPILAPIVALVAWTLVMMIWMIVTRFAAMRRKGISLKGRVGTRTGALEGVIEDSVNWKAHNYMHLVEQPTLFYAIALVLAVTDHGDGINAMLAWAYVGLRIAHSLVQATVNIVLYRFILWVLSSLALIGLTVHAAAVLCSHLRVGVTQGRAAARAASLLLLRLGTGSLLILWGSVRVMAPETGPGLADKYYRGLASVQELQMAYGAAEIGLGLLVCLGLFRRFAYPAQAALLVLGLFAIGKYIVDPLGLWLLAPADAQILFFPSITVAAATLVLIAFRDHDRYALDAKLRPRA